MAKIFIENEYITSRIIHFISFSQILEFDILCLCGVKNIFHCSASSVTVCLYMSLSLYCSRLQIFLIIWPRCSFGYWLCSEREKVSVYVCVRMGQIDVSVCWFALLYRKIGGVGVLIILDLLKGRFAPRALCIRPRGRFYKEKKKRLRLCTGLILVLFAKQIRLEEGWRDFELSLEADL